VPGIRLEMITPTTITAGAAGLYLNGLEDPLLEYAVVLARQHWREFF
jgi:hypothetical protein